jgi:hypothetical protein
MTDFDRLSRESNCLVEFKQLSWQEYSPILPERKQPVSTLKVISKQAHRHSCTGRSFAFIIGGIAHIFCGSCHHHLEHKAVISISVAVEAKRLQGDFGGAMASGLSLAEH